MNAIAIPRRSQASITSASRIEPPGWTTATIPSGFTKDTWITSFEIKPSDLTVTHHICATLVPHREDVKYYEWNWNESPRDEEGVATDAGATPAGAASGVDQAVGASGFGGGFTCYVPGVQVDDFRKVNAA